MTTHIQFLDRDAAVALSKGVNDTSPEEQGVSDEIASLRERIQQARLQLAATEAELDSIALGGHVR